MYKGAIFESVDSIKRYLKARKERIAAEKRLKQLKEEEKRYKEFMEWKRKLEEDMKKAQKEDSGQLEQFHIRLDMLTDEKPC